MYKIKFNHSKDLEVIAWCTEQFGGPNIPRPNCSGNGWYHQVDIERYETLSAFGARVVESIVFDREKDAMLFALKWGA